MNGVLCTVQQIAEAAVEKEKLRRIFYANAAELSTNEDVKSLFHFLMEEEDRHIETFARIRDSLLAETDPGECSPDTVAYMESIIDDRLYSRMNSKDFVRQAIDTKNVFRLAIGFEKDAILFFMDFLPHLSERERRIVEDLIEQEKGHVRKLVQVMKQIGE